jgi:beta-xylosidase
MNRAATPRPTMNPLRTFAFSLLLAVSASAEEKMSGNPIFEGWYADPEGIIFDNQYWVYPTFSAPYDQQLHFDAFSSPDLVKWTKHSKILDTGDIKWAKRAMWAPSIIEKDKKYYFFFAANDIQNNEQAGGIGVAVADRPEGPFKDLLDKPLIDKFHHGAQPIDGFVFKDDDDSYYFIYGGWRHCNIGKLKPGFTGFIPFEDGQTFKSITPEGYVEGPFVFKKNGKYYFMWSEGGWTGPNYKVAYAISDTLMGPHKRIGVVLQQDPAVATGAGHHSVIHSKKDDSWYIVYHRRPLGETDGNHRVTCIDKMEFEADGKIKPVKITKEGVPAKKP